MDSNEKLHMHHKLGPEMFRLPAFSATCLRKHQCFLCGSPASPTVAATTNEIGDTNKIVRMSGSRMSIPKPMSSLSKTGRCYHVLPRYASHLDMKRYQFFRQHFFVGSEHIGANHD